MSEPSVPGIPHPIPGDVEPPSFPIHGRAPVIGSPPPGHSPEQANDLKQFRIRLGELKYTEKTDISIEPRFAADNDASLDDLAGELLRLPVDVIVATSTTAGMAAK